MRGRSLVFVVCALLLLALVPLPAMGLTYFAGAIQTWSNGNQVTGAYGVSGTLRAYAKPSTGTRVNSIYVRDPVFPNTWLVEVGWTATGSSPVPSSLPANHDPWLFAARISNGDYYPADYFTSPFTVDGWTNVSLSRFGDNDWRVNYKGAQVGSFWDNITMGTPWVGEERSNTSMDGRASMQWMKLQLSDGTWDDWWYMEVKETDGSYTWWDNHLQDSNHHIYADDHQNP